MYKFFSNTAEIIARYTAFAGGFVLIALVIMTCISIAGRTLIAFGLSPVKGDFELIELGIGFAIFCFLPLCHLRRGHATVDLFTNQFSAGANRLLDLVADLLMLVVATLLTWRLWVGMIDKQSYGETTFILQYPIWTGYAAGMIGASAFVYVAIFCVLRSLKALLNASDQEALNV